MAIDTATAAEIKRKQQAGIPLTNPTAETTALYNSYKTPTAPKPVIPATSSTQATPPTSNTSTPTMPQAATAGPPAPSGAQTTPTPFNPQAAASNLMNTFASTKDAWTNGTANGQTESQNLAAVINQPGNTVKNTPTPYITSVLDQANKDSGGAQLPPANPGGNGMPQQITQSQGSGSNMRQAFTPSPVSNWSTTPEQARQSAQEIANARMTEMLNGGRNAWNTGITGAKNAYDYSNKITGDNRAIETGQFNEIKNPFAGKTTYDKAMLERDRSIEDTASNANYQNVVNSINQTWADLQSAAPEKQQALYDQLYQQAASIGLQADQLNLQAQNQQFNQGIDQAGVTGIYNGQQTMQANNQAFNQNLALTQQQQDAKNTAFAQQMQINEVAYRDARDAISDARYKTEFENNIKQLGFENAIKKAVTDNQISTDKAQLAISRQNANTSSQNASNSANNANVNQLMDVWKATGKAPAGIPNVTPGTPYGGQAAVKMDYAHDAGFAADVAYLSNHQNEITKLDSNADMFINKYGYDGYLALRKQFGLD